MVAFHYAKRALLFFTTAIAFVMIVNHVGNGWTVYTCIICAIAYILTPSKPHARD
jgi:hypothetical protein